MNIPPVTSPIARALADALRIRQELMNDIPPAVTLYWQEKRIKELEAALEEVLPRYIELFTAQFADDPETSIAVQIMREALGKR